MVLTHNHSLNVQKQVCTGYKLTCLAYIPPDLDHFSSAFLAGIEWVYEAMLLLMFRGILIFNVA